MQKLIQRVHMNCRHYIKPVFAALLSAALLLSGCGDSSRTSGQTENINFHIIEKVIPDPKKIFDNDPENQGRNIFPGMTDSDFQKSMFADAKLNLIQEDSFSDDGKLCFLYNIAYIITDGDKNFPGSTVNYSLYVLEAPYEEWRCYTLTPDCWSSGLSFISPSRILGVSDQGIYLGLYFINDQNRLVPGGIGLCSWDGSCRLLEELNTEFDFEDPLLFENLRLHSAGETLYAVSGDLTENGSSFSSYDAQFQPLRSKNLENRLSGCISTDSGALWYGFDQDQQLTVWDQPDGKKLFSLGNMVNTFSDFQLTRSATGDFILADVSGIWTGDGNSPLQKVLSFTEMGYTLQELFAVTINEDNSISLLVRFEDELYLLTLEQTEDTETQEITLVSYMAPALSNVAAAFNRQSDKYHITLIDPSAANDSEDYLKQLQLELAAGRGPDLISPWVIDLEDCIVNGYLEPLDDLIEDPSEYWPACLENGRTDGILYAVPYRTALSFMATSKSVAKDLNTWTLEQMISAVRNSSAEALQMGLNSLDLVLQYGLMTPDNPQFIDYEAGVSHLTEQPFLDFLEFAKEYGDTLNYSDQSQAAEYYANGRLAAYYLTMNQPSELLFASACFQDQGVLIGRPSAEGRGVRMSSDLLCLNSNSQYKEGAKEFLRYLISAEGQNRFVLNYSQYYQYGVFSCRRDVTETVLNNYQQNTNEESSVSYLGITAKTAPLTDKQVEQFWALFEDASYDFPWPQEIYEIACEELQPFFAGDCSAEEAAGKLDNRVQLYLDEHR